MRYLTGGAFGLLVLALGATGAVAAPLAGAPVPVPSNDQIIRVAADAAVVHVQRKLLEAGYYNGAVDGVAGPRTQAAVRAYEAAAGWPVTGDAYTLASKLGYAAAPATTAPAPAPVVVAPPPPRAPAPLPIVPLLGPGPGPGRPR